MRLAALLLTLLAGIGGAFAAPPKIEKRSDEVNVSLIQLIANPAAFDGKNVSIGGYLTLRGEYENSLFLDENAYRSGMWANAIAVDLKSSKPAIKERAKQQDRKYVLVAGRFKAGPTAFSGGQLQEVYRLFSATDK